MKRILFYAENYCGDKSKGGLEVATWRLANALKESGEWDVYSAFRNKWEGNDIFPYAEVVRLSHNEKKFEKELADFIKRNKIDVVVNMTRFFRHKHIVRAVKSSQRDIKVVFMQHFAPGSEKKKPTYASGWHLLKLNPWNPLYWLRVTVYPLIKLPRNLSLGKIYRKVYDSSDKVVLLSSGYIDDYKKIAGLSDDSKFIGIPNIYEVPTEEKTHEKKRKVLVLSRMDEVQKRVSLALKIWKKVEDEKDFDDWHLDIVGTGHDMNIMKRLAKKLKLSRATFHGWKNREPYLKESPILMMTSEYEGLPLSILEAQAYGCVPIVFDSYASLKDVVEDGKTGVTVKEFGDIDDFAYKLSDLMRDENKRLAISESAKSESNRFSSERICNQWLEMLKTL